MKKFFVFLSMLSLVSISMVSAQEAEINAEKILNKIAKNDAAVADPKKNKKASVWLERGELYYQAANEPIKGLYLGGEKSTLIKGYGQGESGKGTLRNKEYATLDYPYFTVYLDGNKIVAWIMKKYIKENTMDEALKSYLLAYEYDFETAAKVYAGLDNILNYHRQMGNLYNALGEIRKGADAFAKANEVQNLALYKSPYDPQLTFYAGYMYVMDSNSNPDSFEPGEKLLAEAVAKGYCEFEDADEKVEEISRGDIYYYMFHCAYSQCESKPEKLQDAKKYLIDGLARYPRNENVFDALLHIYTAEEGIGDPTDLLATAEETLKLDAKNVNAWYGRGRIYYAVNDYENAIESFEKVIELDPKNQMGYFYLGMFNMHKADAVYNEIKDNSYTDRAKYNEDMARLNTAYAKSIPFFEKSHELKPTDYNTLSYLKQLCFRLRDEPGMKEKYDLYNGKFEALSKK